MYCSPHLFTNHIIYTLIFPIIRDPRYKWVGKSLTCNKHVGFKALCSKQVRFKAFVITLGRSSVRTQLLQIFSSETTWPPETKLWWNGPWVMPFQNCVRQSRPPTNMVAVTKNKKEGWNSKNLHLWIYWANWN